MERNELVNTMRHMFLHALFQRILDFVWQGWWVDILQSRISINDAEEATGFLGCVYSADVVSVGRKYETRLALVLKPGERDQNNPWGLRPVGDVFFVISSIVGLEPVALDCFALKSNHRAIFCYPDHHSEKNLRSMWFALGLNKDQAIPRRNI